MTEATEPDKPITTVEEAVQIVEEYAGAASNLRLAIGECMLDPVGVNMAIITDRILAKGFEPNGYEQRNGYRIYKYKDRDLE